MASRKERKHALSKAKHSWQYRFNKKRKLKEQVKKPSHNLSKRETLSILMSLVLTYIFCTVFFKMLLTIVELTSKLSVLPFILIVLSAAIYIIVMIVFYKTCRPYTDKAANKIANFHNRRKVKKYNKKSKA